MARASYAVRIEPASAALDPIANSAHCRCLRPEARSGTGSECTPNRCLIEPLTERELEILGELCEGASNSEISARIGVSLPTVKYHLYQIFGKLGVLRRTQAVAVAIHLRLVSPAWLQPS